MSTGASPNELPDEDGSTPTTYVFLEMGSWRSHLEEKTFREVLEMETYSHEDPEEAVDGSEPLLRIGRQEGSNEYEFVGATEDVNGVMEKFERAAELQGYESSDLKFAYK